MLILGGAEMGYMRALEVLPDEMVREIQNYVEGELIYIPKLTKAGWGAKTSTKAVLEKRNREIYADYHKGMSISELSQKYYLAEKSMSRIIKQENGKK